MAGILIASASPVVCDTAAFADTPGATATWHLNRDALAPLDLEIRLDGRQEGGTTEPYASVRCGLGAGAAPLELGCALHLQHADSTVTLSELQLQSERADPTRAEWRDADARIWFVLDHAHVADGGLAGQHANLRPGPALLQWLGRPLADPPVIGGVDWESPVPPDPARSDQARSNPARSAAPACGAPWASADSPAAIRLLAMAPNFETHRPDTIAFERCTQWSATGAPSPCSNDSRDGEVVFAPDASLENVGGTAVPWHAMFSGRFAPYDNDQHPFLIWNLYREERDGSLRQIGRSGVKHAFYALNIGCGCAAGHVVYPRCQDTYSSFNNDSLAFLGPRAEVIPARGLWAPCGSVFDRDCDGVPGPRSPGEDDGHRWRMNVGERDLKISGARYFFEYGYVVRDQRERERAFGWREVHPEKRPGAAGFATWQLSPGTLHDGFVVSRWLRSAPPGTRVESRTFTSAAGGGRVGVRVTKLASGRYRYCYVIQNVDWAVATTTETAHGLRMNASRGIDRVELWPVAPAALSAPPPGATGSGRDWPLSRAFEHVAWTAADNNDLVWGSLLTIQFDSDTPPRPGHLRVSAGPSAHAEVEIPVPRI